MAAWFRYYPHNPDHGQIVGVFRPTRKRNRTFLAVYVISSRHEGYAWQIYDGTFPTPVLRPRPSDLWAVPILPKLPM